MVTVAVDRRLDAYSNPMKRPNWRFRISSTRVDRARSAGISFQKIRMFIGMRMTTIGAIHARSNP